MTKNKTVTAAVVTAVILIIIFIVLDRYNLIPKRHYTAEHFGIETVRAQTDFDSDGADDYTEIMLGARLDAKKHPRYIAMYYQNGYPPENEGVCTDVIWRAFKNAGYSLREMVHADIESARDAYPHITVRDKNIDFRRVPNLKIFFDRHAQSLTTDTSDIAAFQPGDIVITNGTKHIGIVSDKRNKNGVPYFIHNLGQLNREEDVLERADITAHYRFDASKTDDSLLIAWQD